MVMSDADVEMSAKILWEIAEANQNVDTFRHQLEELRKENGNRLSETEFIRQCEQMAAALIQEHKAHTEELRLINQDINHLEDLIKNSRKGFDSRELTLRQMVGEFRRDAQEIRRLLVDSQLFGGFRADWTEIETQWFAEFAEKPPAEFPQPPSPPASTSFPISPLFPQFLKSPLNSADIVTNSSVQTDPRKLKQCTVCFRSIHRNSPSCVHCKNRTPSQHRRRKKPPTLLSPMELNRII